MLISGLLEKTPPERSFFVYLLTGFRELFSCSFMDPNKRVRSWKRLSNRTFWCKHTTKSGSPGGFSNNTGNGNLQKGDYILTKL